MPEQDFLPGKSKILKKITAYNLLLNFIILPDETAGDSFTCWPGLA
jgi:hypothetical protein